MSSSACFISCVIDRILDPVVEKGVYFFVILPMLPSVNWSPTTLVSLVL